MTPYGCNTCVGDEPNVLSAKTQSQKSNLQFLLSFIWCVIRVFVWCIVHSMRYLLSSFFIILSLACGSPNSGAPVSVMVLVPVEKQGGFEFEPRRQQLTTISDISKLEGSVTSLIGGARMFWDDNDPKLNAAQSIEEIKKALFKKEGGSVRAQFIEKDGVLWPTDFHSWAMVTTYWNLEQAFLYFQEMYDGRATEELLNVPTYYWLDTNMMNPDEKESNTDNAFFHGAFRMMAVLPFKDFQTIPMSINIGVMAHEYAHFVFDARVHHADIDSDTHTDPDKAPAVILDSLNEGLADFHAYGVTRRLNPQGSVRSFEWTLDEKEANRRDFSDPKKCWSTLEHQNIYTIGTLFAASFYQAAMEVGKFDSMAKFIIHAYDSNAIGKPPGIRQHYIQNAETPQNISLESVADVFLAHITDNDLKRRTCNQLLDRFAFEKEYLPNCPESSASNNQCGNK